MITLAMTLLSLAILIALMWLLFGSSFGFSLASQKNRTDLKFDGEEIEKLLPTHCRYFAQVGQVLKEEDYQFMLKRAPRDVERKWRAERRHILKQYLQALRQDFTGLARLARLIATLSPEVHRAQEWEWFWLGLQFRLLYQIAVLHIAFGSFSPPELANLTEMIAMLGGELENRMSLITEYPSNVPA